MDCNGDGIVYKSLNLIDELVFCGNGLWKNLIDESVFLLTFNLLNSILVLIGNWYISILVFLVGNIVIYTTKFELVVAIRTGINNWYIGIICWSFYFIKQYLNW